MVVFLDLSSKQCVGVGKIKKYNFNFLEYNSFAILKDQSCKIDSHQNRINITTLRYLPIIERFNPGQDHQASGFTPKHIAQQMKGPDFIERNDIPCTGRQSQIAPKEGGSNLVESGYHLSFSLRMVKRTHHR